MKRIINFKSFNVFSIEKEVWDVEYHNHNFYEIVIIAQGEGLHCLNCVKMKYKKGDVFLLTPNDAHEFEIEQKTKFFYIKFTEQFFVEKILKEKTANQRDFFNLMLKSQLTTGDSWITDKNDQKSVLCLAEILAKEFSEQKNYSDILCYELFSGIMMILLRNISEINNERELLNNEEEKLQKIISYINVNIYDSELLKIENLAEQFHLSPNYISSFVKKHTGFSVKQHIENYKLATAEAFLKQSNFNINEISSKIGFNDASHFNKFFRKHKGISPKNFRKKI